MATTIHQRLEDARAGKNPAVITRMPSGWLVLADTQFLRGYSILLADPVVPDLNALDYAGRARFLLDMAIVGDALLAVTAAFRINYEILGNSDPVLHAHILPRYMTEPEDLRKGPAWFYDLAYRQSLPFDAVRDKALMGQIAKAIQENI